MNSEPTRSETNAKPKRAKAPTPDTAAPQASAAFAAEVTPLGAAIERPELASPEMILRLQRTAGNRAVQRLLASRRVQAKLTVGPASDEYEQEADRVASQVMRMPTPVQRAPEEEEDGIQRKPLAAGISAVPLRPSPASIQPSSSPASPDGSFEAGAHIETRLAARHGQGQPLSDGTRAFMESRFGADFGGVRIHSDPEAVQMSRDLSARAFTHGSDIYVGQGGLATGTESGKQLLAHELTHVVQQGGAAGPVQRTPGSVIQRMPKIFEKLFGGKKEKEKDKGKDDSGGKGDGQKAPESTEVAKPDEMMADSKDYEHRLGVYGFNHAKATEAAKKMLEGMGKALVGELNYDDKSQNQQLAETFGKEAPESSGQVGKNAEAILAVFQSGNLRERLTAIYNAMFGPFKTYLTSALHNFKWKELGARGLDVNKLKRRKRQWYMGLGKRDLYRNPYAKFDRKKLKDYQKFGQVRSGVPETDVQSTERTAGELEQEGIGLSEREKKHQFGDQEDVGGEKLKWKEGAAWHKINENNAWVKQAKNSLHMPLMAGPSGTMQRMMQLWEWLKRPVPAVNWRLAVMAWMLTGNDHSFHEMMVAAAMYGLPYRPGQTAYMDVKPLTVWELRQNVAKDGLFPHELAFQRKFQAGGMKNIMDQHALTSAKDDLQWVPQSKEESVGAASPAAAAAINLYTRFGYLILNPVKRGGPQAETMIKKAIEEKDELAHFREPLKKGEITVAELIKQAREVLPMIESGLETLPDWKGKVYRGIATNSKWTFAMTRTFKFDKMGSATTNLKTAKKFADDMASGKYKYIEEMEVTAGKDLSALSEYAHEDEILLPPGSAFSVGRRTKPTKDDPYYHVAMTQTARGGNQLVLGQRPDEPQMLKDSGPKGPVVPGTLRIYEQADVTAPNELVGQDEVDMLDDPQEQQGGWTRFNYTMTWTWWFAKTDEFKAFMSYAGGSPKEEAPNPLKGLLNLPTGTTIQYSQMMGTGGDLSAPVGIEIMDDDWENVEGWQYVQVKLANGQFVMLYQDDLAKYFQSGGKQAPPSSSNIIEEEAPSQGPKPSTSVSEDQVPSNPELQKKPKEPLTLYDDFYADMEHWEDCKDPEDVLEPHIQEQDMSNSGIGIMVQIKIRSGRKVWAKKAELDEFLS